MTTINLKTYAQGVYSGNGQMVAAQPATVKLHNGSEVIETFETTLATDGTLSVETSTEGIFDVSVRTHNTLEVFAASKLNVSGASVSYDFTTSSDQAAGSNQVEVEPGVFAMYSGDIDGSGEINALDYDAWVVAYEAFAEGGATDLNGDGLVDANDYLLYEANIGKSVIRP